MPIDQRRRQILIRSKWSLKQKWSKILAKFEFNNCVLSERDWGGLSCNRQTHTQIVSRLLAVNLAHPTQGDRFRTILIWNNTCWWSRLAFTRHLPLIKQICTENLRAEKSTQSKISCVFKIFGLKNLLLLESSFWSDLAVQLLGAAPQCSFSVQLLQLNNMQPSAGCPSVVTMQRFNG